MKSVLKSSVHDMIETNKQKNHIGSAMGVYNEAMDRYNYTQMLMHTYMHTYIHECNSWLYRRIQCARCQHCDGRFPRYRAGSHTCMHLHTYIYIYITPFATEQDPAQNVESSNCLTIMEYADDGKSLHVSVTMPSIEVVALPCPDS